MKIHYISCHSILEYDELKLLTDLGHEVFSNGAYLDPRGHITLPRPNVPKAKYYEDWAKLATQTAKTNIPQELIDPFDVIIVMHSPTVITENWQKMRHKKVIWRTIGQSIGITEDTLSEHRRDGLKIVRYSPKERNIPNYLGEDTLIRFYKDEDELSNWNGKTNSVLTFSQSLKGRRDHCHYDQIMPVIEKFDGIIYGPGNDDLGKFNGGCIPYDMQIQKMQDARAMIYGGTAPASYTLSFVEALMTGTPIVAINSRLANIIYNFDFYEVEDLLNQVGGIVCDSVDQMNEATTRLIQDYDYATQISSQQRDFAIEHFGKKKIIKQWEDYLNGI